MRMSRKCILFGSAGGEPIDVGAMGDDQSTTTTGGSTFIVAANPANAAGRITSIQFKIYSAGSINSLTVGIFTQVDTNVFSTRDYTTITESMTGGTYSRPVNLSIKAGDYIGFYFPSGSGITGVSSGGSGRWKLSGNYIPCTNQSFGSPSGTADLWLMGIGIT